MTQSALRSRPILHSQVNFPLCLAPMVGLSHVATRLLLRQYLPAQARTIWPTEMLNSRRLPYEDLTTTPETKRSPLEEDLVPQILGNEEKFIQDSLQRLEHEWGASGIDINMGCPVNKALRHNYGVALMGDADYAAEVVRMTVKHTGLPVSVKLRAGLQGDFEFLRSFVDGIQSAGASWVTLHPRTAEQKRRGRADWEQIAKLRQHVRIPVIGNGDIQTADDVRMMLDQTGCDMVMAGRALIARPWLLWQLGEDLGFTAPLGREGERAPRAPEEEGAECGRALLNLISLCRDHFPENLAVKKLRFFVKTGSVWLHFGHELWSKFTGAVTLDECEVVVREFFAYPQAMNSRTELRQ